MTSRRASVPRCRRHRVPASAPKDASSRSSRRKAREYRPAEACGPFPEFLVRRGGLHRKDVGGPGRKHDPLLGIAEPRVVQNILRRIVMCRRMKSRSSLGVGFASLIVGLLALLSKETFGADRVGGGALTPPAVASSLLMAMRLTSERACSDFGSVIVNIPSRNYASALSYKNAVERDLPLERAVKALGKVFAASRFARPSSRPATSKPRW